MSWERMTRLRSEGRPFFRSRTAAEVSSQLVSMPRIGLVATDGAGPEARVGSVAPGVLPDDLLDDEGLLVEEEALRHAGGLVDLLDAHAQVVQALEGETVIPGEAPD